MNQSKLQIERDCTEKCKSTKHGDVLSSVITKRDVTDEELCAYIRWLCSNCGQVCDSVGRTALHFAASCGRTKLVKWLIRNKGAQINAKDLESGYTALHRSIFYGKINVAVTLTQLGANVGLMDHNDLTAIEHAMKDKKSDKSEDLYKNQIYVWGTNTNYTLGTGSPQARQLPELNEAFHKKFPGGSVVQICLEKFHCMILCEVPQALPAVYSCGHGQGGRLGLKHENTVLVPEEVSFPKVRGEFFQCGQISIARDHSMFLSKNGLVLVCGLNTHHVLGIKPPPQLVLEPTLVPLNGTVRGVCAGRYHSVAWGSDFVYTWGLHAGQLGHPHSSNTTIVAPKVVPYFVKKEVVVAVAASDGATVVATDKGNVFALHEYQCRRIASRQVNITKIVVVGGHLDPKVSCGEILTEKGGNELKVLVLLKSGNLLLWQESWPQLSRCIYNLNRPLIAVDAVLSPSELFFVTGDREAFKGDFRPRKKKPPTFDHSEKKSAFHEFLEKDDCQLIFVNKFPHIHRALKIECDHKGRNFAAIQSSPKVYDLSADKLAPKALKKDMKNVLNSIDITDNIHDGVFKVCGELFPVHKFIVAHKSEPLLQMLQTNDNPVEITDIDTETFKELLTFMYTNSCEILDYENIPIIVMGQFDKDHPRTTPTITPNSPLGLLRQAANRFQMFSLLQAIKQINCYNSKSVNLDCYFYMAFNNFFNEETAVTFDRRKYLNLSDVIVKSKNGGEIPAHKCILTRIEYFKSLFAARWNENSEKTVVSLQVPMNVLEAVMDFIYTENELIYNRDIDFVCNVLVISDQLFIEGLKENCEKYLSELLSLKNVAHMFQFAYTYNANMLKNHCMSFIKNNLAAILEMKSLEILDIGLLDKLTEYNCKSKLYSNRIITSFSTAPSDEEVKHIYKLFPLNMEDDQECFEKRTPKINRKRQRVRKSSCSENNRKDGMDIEVSIIEDDKPENIKKPDEKWIQILTDKQKHQKLVKTRLRAIASAKEEVESESSTGKLTKLISQPYKIPKTEFPIDRPSTSGASLLFPPSSSGTGFEILKSPTMSDIPIQKAQKMSQKQRKKLAAELSVSSMAQELDNINKKPSWNTIVSSKDTNSFSDILKSEKDFPEVGSASPRNPWQKMEVSSPIVSPENQQNFKDIVADEKKLKENWTKMRDRPLTSIQMEDKAMNELERFYNVDQVSEEYITIHKVEKCAFAVPTWVQPNNKH